MSRRNVLRMFVFTLALYGGLNHVIFLLQLLLAGGGHVNLIFLLKLLSLSTLLYAGTALSKCSLPQDISDILMLTIDGIIILVIAGGCFDCKVKYLVIIFCVWIFVSS